MLCVNFTWLGTNSFQLQLELHSSALGEIIQISFFVYFCMLIDATFYESVICLFVCVEVLRPSQPSRVMSSVVSLPNHTFTGQA